MALKALTKSREQQLTKREIQSKESCKIEADFHLSMFFNQIL